jgi:hypothetical protein
VAGEAADVLGEAVEAERAQVELDVRGDVEQR